MVKHPCQFMPRILGIVVHGSVTIVILVLLHGLNLLGILPFSKRLLSRRAPPSQRGFARARTLLVNGYPFLSRRGDTLFLLESFLTSLSILLCRRFSRSPP